MISDGSSRPSELNCGGELEKDMGFGKRDLPPFGVDISAVITATRVFVSMVQSRSELLIVRKVQVTVHFVELKTHCK